MTNEHLSDLEIQQYVLKKDECDSRITGHIRQCSPCAEKAAAYNTLFAGIRQQEKPSFDFPLADIVVAQLPPPRQKDQFDKVIVFVVALAILALIAAVLYLFKDISLEINWDISPVSVALILITLIGIAAFLLTDMYRKYQRQINALTQ